RRSCAVTLWDMLSGMPWQTGKSALRFLPKAKLRRHFVGHAFQHVLADWKVCPTSVLPGLVSLALLVGCSMQPRRRRLWTWLLCGWAGVHLVGGAILSVLPLPIWPFYPEQSAGHCLSHVIYGLAQLPLMWVLLKENRS
ncbi:MAG: hypothetical protein D6775_16240, partial [Caldilineae bacterium]